MWHRSENLAFALILGGVADIALGTHASCIIKGVLQVRAQTCHRRFSILLPLPQLLLLLLLVRLRPPSPHETAFPLPCTRLRPPSGPPLQHCFVHHPWHGRTAFHGTILLPRGYGCERACRSWMRCRAQ